MSKAQLPHIDYRAGKTPGWVEEIINTQLAIEQEDAARAGQVGYMARALVTATMPYKDPKADVFVRKNGNFKLRIVAGYDGGIPYGIYPRLLMSWVTTEAVRTQSPRIELGDSLSQFLRNVLEIRSDSGGPRGSATRVAEQMKRLFGSLITAQYESTTERGKNFLLRNVLIAESLEMEDSDFSNLWTPQASDEAGKWKSFLDLSKPFYRECIGYPVPIDLRVYKGLRKSRSPLAMDVYTWLTYRMSYTDRKTKPIPWEALMMQFGSGFSGSDPGQARRDFRKAFLVALSAVKKFYPAADVEVLESGLVLLPSPTHVESLRQQSLF